MADRLALLNETLDNYYRIRLLLTRVLANPTQTNIDAAVAAATGLGLVNPKVSHSVDGKSYDWTGYQTALHAMIMDTRREIQEESGPFEIRSRGIT